MSFILRCLCSLPALVAVASLGSAEAVAAGPLGRDADPIVVTGSTVPELLGTAPGRIVAFGYDGGWRQVPVQVDERSLVDLAAVRAGYQTANRPLSAISYSDPGTFAGADPDPALDADDEIAAMAMDSGDGAPDGKADPPGVRDGSRTELRVVDPLEPGPARFLYLFASAGDLDPSAGRSYVDYDFRLLSGDYRSTYDFDGVPNGDNTQSGPPGNPESSTVETDFYHQRLPARWLADELAIRSGTGVDILDGDKAQVAYGCSRSELTFSRGGGGFIANISGPVRAIRSYIGANSGTYTQRDQIYYQRSEQTRVTLRVHPGISVISQFLDYSPAASGMTYRNSAQPAGVTIDGLPDPSLETGNALGPPITWEQATGEQGTLSIVNRLVTDMPGVNVGSYYQDDVTPSTTQCSGYADAQAWGASGSAISNAGQNTDPTLGAAYSFTGTRNTFFSAPGGDAALAAKRSAQVDSPLQVSLGNGGSGRAELGLRARGPKRARVGKRLKVSVRVKNTGEASAGGVRVCSEAKRRHVETGPCEKVEDLAAGGSEKLALRVRVRAGAAKRRFVRVRVEARIGGKRAASDSVRIRVVGGRRR